MLTRHEGWARWTYCVLLCCLYATAGWAQMTAPVFIPGYRERDWEVLRGSIVSSDASITRYTVFCQHQTPLDCQLAGDLPFEFAEGPGTLNFGGTIANKITADLQCQLAGSTAATCTGSTSYGATYTQGAITGPTATSWSTTYTASEVVWGVLTMATPDPGASASDADEPVVDTQRLTASAMSTVHTGAAVGCFRAAQGLLGLTVAVMAGLLAM